MTAIERLSEVRNKVQRAAEKSGRNSELVELIAVSKTWPIEDIFPFFEAGQLHFGENKVQELQEKCAELPDASWHMIGGLQRNKVRRVLELVTSIHSVDSMKLAQSIDRISAELGLKTNCFLQVNIGLEATKGGFEKAELLKGYSEVADLKHLKVEGLMCIPPAVEKVEDSRKYFAELREFRDELEIVTEHSLSGLSMGMSHDYEVAIEEGATHVRVGSALFGARQYQM